jgi:hypothetical protein
LTKKTKTICWLVIFLIIAALGLYGYLFCTRGVQINITNQSKNIINNVELSFRGGIITVGNLKPKQSKIVYVNPAGESALDVNWSDSNGLHHQYIDTYMEHNYGGHGDIILSENAEVNWISNIRTGIP